MHNVQEAACTNADTTPSHEHRNSCPTLQDTQAIHDTRVAFQLHEPTARQCPDGHLASATPPTEESTRTVSEFRSKVHVFWIFSTEGDVALLASKQNRCWSVPPVTFITRMSRGVSTPPRKTERSTTPSSVPEATLPLSANLTITACSQSKKHHAKLLQTCSHHQMVHVRVSHHIPHSTAVSHP